MSAKKFFLILVIAALITAAFGLAMVAVAIELVKSFVSEQTRTAVFAWLEKDFDIIFAACIVLAALALLQLRKFFLWWRQALVSDRTFLSPIIQIALLLAIYASFNLLAEEKLLFFITAGSLIVLYVMVCRKGIEIENNVDYFLELKKLGRCHEN